ncbi:MAG: hypothetical protein ACKVW3_06425 [Phycisphaerales bacterium]
MATLPGQQCPECGYAVTDEDRTLAERRELYLDGAMWDWGVLILILGFAFLSMRGIEYPGNLFWFIGIGATFGWAVVVGSFACRGTPRLHRRVFMRAWCVALLYWMALQPVVFYLALLLLVIADTYDPIGRLWMLVSIIGGMVCGSVLTIPIWHRAWRRTSRLAGVPEVMRTRRAFWRIARFVVWPLMVLALPFFVGIVVAALMWALDTFAPGWHLSP